MKRQPEINPLLPERLHSDDYQISEELVETFSPIETTEKNKISKSPKFYLSNKIKSSVFLLVHFISFIVSSVYIRNTFFNLEPYQAAFFHTFTLAIILPFSFIRNLFTSRVIEKKKNEEEKSEEEIVDNILQENFSFIMDSKFYENYSKYSKRFYYLLSVLLVSYFLALFLFYLSLEQLEPFFINILLSSSSLLIIPGKYILKRKFKKVNLYQFLVCLCTFFSFLFAFLFEKNNSKPNSSYKILGIVFIVCSILLNSFFVIFLKIINNKFKHYIKIEDLAGFIGTITIILYLILVLSLILFGYTDFSSALFCQIEHGATMFLFIGKGVFAGVICDFTLMKLIQYCSFGQLGSIFGLNLGGVCSLYLINNKIGFSFKELTIYLYLFGEFFAVLTLILIIVKVVTKKDKNVYVEHYKNNI